MASQLEATTSVPSKAIEVDEAQVPEEVKIEAEEISVITTNIEEVFVATSDATSTDVGLSISTEEIILDVDASEIETPTTNISPSSTKTPEVQQSADVTNISEEPILSKKNTDEESVKSGNKLLLIY